jgi:hypothetical protein
VNIIISVEDNQLPFVLVLARSDSPSEELQYWVDIVKHGNDNQLSIITTKFLGGFRLKQWVEINKYVKDNQLLIVDQLAA